MDLLNVPPSKYSDGISKDIFEMLIKEIENDDCNVIF